MAFVNVQGEVSRIHSSGGGFGLRETWTVQGKERTRYWAIFTKDPVQVGVGDRVKVSGGLQTKVTEPKEDGRVFVDHTVGQAQVEVVQAAGGGSSGGSQGQWVNTPVQDSAPPQGGFGQGEFEQPF